MYPSVHYDEVLKQPDIILSGVASMTVVVEANCIHLAARLELQINLKIYLPFPCFLK